MTGMPFRVPDVMPCQPPFPLGLYVDKSYENLSSLAGINQTTAKSYLGKLAKFSGAHSALFPVVRKNDKADPEKAISVKDANVIISEGLLKLRQRKIINAYTLRHHAIARLLKNGDSLEKIQYESGYSDMQSIRDIARNYGFQIKRNPKFSPPRALGLCVSGSVYEAFEDYYPNHLYES